MTNFDLLDYVQPSDGFFCVLGIKGPKDVKQKVVATRAELDGWTKKFVQEKRNVFYNVAKLQTIDGGRVKENVSALKSFWINSSTTFSPAIILGIVTHSRLTSLSPMK